jgi:hypothetical protein
MKKLLSGIVLATYVAFLAPAEAIAGSDAPAVVISPVEEVLASATLAAERTSSCFSVAGKHLFDLDHELTRGGSVTAVRTRCFGHRTSTCADTKPKRLLRCVGDDCQQARPNYLGEDGAGISASDGWSFRFRTSGFTYIQCKFTSTGGGASDSLVVTKYTVQE